MSKLNVSDEKAQEFLDHYVTQYESINQESRLRRDSKYSAKYQKIWFYIY